MFRDSSPTFGPSHFSSGQAPPTPPFSAQTDPLDDIYGSEPSSPALAPQPSVPQSNSHSKPDEILSDLPSRQRALDTDAYREGLSNSKGQFVQEGFDEGYSLGANLGQNVGYILGVLQGFNNALKGHENTRELLATAQKELTIEQLFGQEWIDEEGIWKWEVKGEEEEVTFREVAAQHPVVKKWSETIEALAEKWGVSLQALEKSDEVEEERS